LQQRDLAARSVAAALHELEAMPHIVLVLVLPSGINLQIWPDKTMPSEHQPAERQPIVSDENLDAATP
jgi:hypothetical protein